MNKLCGSLTTKINEDLDGRAMGNIPNEDFSVCACVTGKRRIDNNFHLLQRRIHQTIRSNSTEQRSGKGGDKGELGVIPNTRTQIT